MILQPLGVTVVANWRHFHSPTSVCFALLALEGVVGMEEVLQLLGCTQGSPSFHCRLVGPGERRHS